MEPVAWVPIALGGPEEFAGSFDALGAARGQCVIDHVGCTERVEDGKIAAAVAEAVELGHNRLVEGGIHPTVIDRAVGVVLVRGGVVHVGGKPDIANVGAFQLAEDF